MLSRPSEKRFNIGDWILVDGVVEGTVEDIGFRSTIVRRFDKAPVYVPNARLADSAVTNFSSMTHRRFLWHIGVEYRTTIEQLRRIRDEIMFSLPFRFRADQIIALFDRPAARLASIQKEVEAFEPQPRDPDLEEE